MTKGGIRAGRQHASDRCDDRLQQQRVWAGARLLAPNGVQLNDDDRNRDQLQITADTNVSVRRQDLVPNP